MRHRNLVDAIVLSFKKIVRAGLTFLGRGRAEAAVWNCGSGVFRGWAWDPVQPERSLEVEVSLNGRKISVLAADQLLFGDALPPRAAFCGFEYILPDHYRSGKILHVSFKQASGREVAGSPFLIQPTGPEGGGAGEFSLDDISTAVLDRHRNGAALSATDQAQAKVTCNLQDVAIVKSRYAFASNDPGIHCVRGYEEYRPDLPYALILRDVYVDLENGTIFLPDGRIWRPATYLRNGDAIATARDRISRGDTDGNIDRRIALLVTTMSWNYFHWHLDCLASWFGVSELLPNYATEVMAPPLTELQSLSFSLLSGKPAICEDGLKHCREVLVGSAFDGRGIRPDRSTVRMFDRIRLAAARTGRDAHEGTANRDLLFISRKDSPRRVLENEDELFERLLPFGFTRVLLSQIDYPAQIQLFYNARCVVGVHGAGLTNLGFCREGCQVFEIIPASYINGCFRFLSAAKNLRHCWFVAPESEPFTVSVPHFMRFFDTHFDRRAA
jgi:capsular polysaccharide biosynthesis protein